jgi:hypothetical protein
MQVLQHDGLQQGSQRGLQMKGRHEGGQQDGGGQQIGLYREGLELRRALGLATALGDLDACCGVDGACAGEDDPSFDSNIISAPDSLGIASDFTPSSSCVRSQLSMPLSCTSSALWAS